MVSSFGCGWVALCSSVVWFVLLAADTATLFDELLGEFLHSLTKQGLANDVLIVVTGDHGLRIRAEFESLGEECGDRDVAFNVPFLLYAPGLFESHVRLTYDTSHVDITPTLLALSGINSDSWLHHGGNMLDQRLRDRVTFMMNGDVSPVQGFHWNGCDYTVNSLTGQVRVRPGAATVEREPLEPSDLEQRGARLSDEAVRSTLERADRLFETTAAYFHQRKAGPKSKTSPDSR